MPILDILFYISQGLANRTIAKKIKVSLSDVEKIRRRAEIYHVKWSDDLTSDLAHELLYPDNHIVGFGDANPGLGYFISGFDLTSQYLYNLYRAKCLDKHLYAYDWPVFCQKIAAINYPDTRIYKSQIILERYKLNDYNILIGRDWYSDYATYAVVTAESPREYAYAIKHIISTIGIAPNAIIMSTGTTKDLLAALNNIAKHLGANIVLSAKNISVFTDAIKPMRNDIMLNDNVYDDKYGTRFEIKSDLDYLCGKHNTENFYLDFKFTRQEALSYARIIASSRKDILQQYEYIEERTVKVQYNYHVLIDDTYYSVPCRMVGWTLNAHIADSSIAIYTKYNKLVCKHDIPSTTQKYVTNPEHMPAMEHYYDPLPYGKWHPAKILWVGGRIGKNTRTVFDHLLRNAKYPCYAYRLCISIIGKAQSYSKNEIKREAEMQKKHEQIEHICTQLVEEYKQGLVDINGHTVRNHFGWNFDNKDLD